MQINRHAYRLHNLGFLLIDRYSPFRILSFIEHARSACIAICTSFWAPPRRRSACISPRRCRPWATAAPWDQLWSYSTRRTIQSRWKAVRTGAYLNLWLFKTYFKAALSLFNLLRSCFEPIWDMLQTDFKPGLNVNLSDTCLKPIQNCFKPTLNQFKPALNLICLKPTLRIL